MSDASLSVRLFLGSIAMAAFALGVNQAGWRHRVLVISLFVVAGLAALAAIFYPSMNFSPHFSMSLSNIASNAWVWFGLVIFLALYSLIGPIRRADPQPEQPAAATAIPEIVRAIAPIITTTQVSGDSGVGRAQELMNLCEGRTDVEIEQISSEHAGELLELSAVVYNVRASGAGSASISLDPDPLGVRLIHARVSDKTLAERALTLRKGDKLNVRGQIANIAKNAITHVDCEFTRWL
jgi:hypothetical protein